MIIKSLHHHIDNGGISIEIHKDEDGFIVIKQDATYFGYPSVRSELSLNGRLGSEFLKDVGLMFLAAAQKLEDMPKEVE